MPAKIRLQRQGRKFQAIYSIVVADSRAPRDGKFIESLGQYNPNTNPATIVLDFDKAIDWLQKGAQPTDTCRAILSYKGVLYKKHLLEGVKKGAFDEAEAEKRFQAWMIEKEQKIQSGKDKLRSAKDSDEKSRLEAETAIKEKRALELAKRRSELIAAEAAAAAPAEITAEVPAEEPEAASEETETVAEVPAEAPVEASEATEAVAEEVTEAPVEASEATEAVAESPAEVPAEEPEAETEETEAVAEVPAEVPAEEPEAEDEDKKKEE